MIPGDSALGFVASSIRDSASSTLVNAAQLMTTLARTRRSFAPPLRDLEYRCPQYRVPRPIPPPERFAGAPIPTCPAAPKISARRFIRTPRTSRTTALSRRRPKAAEPNSRGSATQWQDRDRPSASNGSTRHGTAWCTCTSHRQNRSAREPVREAGRDPELSPIAGLERTPTHFPKTVRRPSKIDGDVEDLSGRSDVRVCLAG